MKVIQNLLTVKSIVTLVLTVVFAYLSVTGQVSGEQFLTICLICFQTVQKLVYLMLTNWVTQ